MKHILFPLFLLVSFCFNSTGQSSVLTIEKIMRDPKWIGSSPSQLFWGQNNNLYFKWNPDNSKDDSLYYVNPDKLSPKKNIDESQSDILRPGRVKYNFDRTEFCYNLDGDIIFVNKKKQKIRVQNTKDYESLIGFNVEGTKINYQIDDNIYQWNIKDGTTEQLLLISNNRTTSSGAEKKGEPKPSLLQKEQYRLFPVFEELDEKPAGNRTKQKKAKNKNTFIYNSEEGRLDQIELSPDTKFITFRTSKSGKDAIGTQVPNYVTRSGYTNYLDARPKVGEINFSNKLEYYSFERDTFVVIDNSNLPGIKVLPEFYDSYPIVRDSLNRLNKAKECYINDPTWSGSGHTAIIQVYSYDFKDRWICFFDGKSDQLQTLDHQHDEAWIGGPMNGSVYYQGYLRWIDKDNIIFSSEVSGYSHLYIYNIKTKIKRSLTQGEYEIQSAVLSNDKQAIFLVTNQSDPGTQTILRLNIKSGKQEVITQLGTGLDDVEFSGDQKYVAFLSSSANTPWELYVQEAKRGGKLNKITNKGSSPEFLTYQWRVPEIIKVKAQDGVDVYARLYKPKVQDPLKPAVIFVHGAGYLQNAHKWWSYYFREYMFHNMLADLGYTVLDMDYRASAGYGRDVRTDIYRHMGGKDLSDQVDGAKYLVNQCNVDSGRIGIYGGSYGGFITLMALFTEPKVFKAGAALRPVTDWMHYNHGYTAQILNTPAQDSISFARSSPINFAEGLENRLLICHGMVDTNVHFQDVVRLQQRLIDLGKDHWEVAAYPTQAHGFTQPSSWTDEYKRIFKMFEEELRDKH